MIAHTKNHLVTSLIGCKSMCGHLSLIITSEEGGIKALLFGCMIKGPFHGTIK